MTMFDPNDEITGSEDVIALDEVTARIAALKPFHVEDTRVPETAMKDPSIASYTTREKAEWHVSVHGEGVREHLEVVEYADESEELAALHELEEAMRGHTGGSEGMNPRAVHERHLADYVRDELEDVYGEEAIASTACHTDWDAVAAEHATDMTATRYRGSLYYITT
jgi:hypothetical protein